MESPIELKRFAITGHPSLPDAIAEAGFVADYLRGYGFSADTGSLNDENIRRKIFDKQYDAMVAIGGDGTMLRASNICAPQGIPVLGINKGRLGFLFQVVEGGWKPLIDQVIAGDYWIENRMMLNAELSRSSEIIGQWSALNDVVVSRGYIIRPIHVEARVDDKYLTRYVCDGLIASTATGSTAYALASGGPILPPELRNILLIPIAPHLSVDRAVVLSEGTKVSMKVLSENSVMSVDGQPPVFLEVGDIVNTNAGIFAAKFIRFGETDYFYRNLTAHMNQNALTGLPR